MLRLMRQVPDPVGRFGANLRAIYSGGEPVGKELLEWGAEVLKMPINEVFGQTECNLVLGSNPSVMPIKPGSIGRAVPGHVAAIVNDAGEELAARHNRQYRHSAAGSSDDAGILAQSAGHSRQICQRLADHRRSRESATKTGYFWFQGRADDVITSGGYRIGPSEIEDALARHPAVVMAAAVGVPDPIRTESIKAFVVLRDGFSPSHQLVDEIRNFVRDHLAKHEVPRDVEFVTALPMTTTGKIVRRELRDAERAKLAGK